MNKNLNPFDIDMMFMIEDVTGNKCKIDKLTGMDKDIVLIRFRGQLSEALKNAIIGRLGDRYLNIISIGLDNELSFVDSDENYPKEIRTEFKEPNLSVGKIFIPAYLEIKAIQLLKTNIDLVLEFTGGGIIITDDNTLKYSFISQYGTFIDVLENQYIICNPDGNFKIMGKREFDIHFELKNSHNVGNYEGAINTPE